MDESALERFLDHFVVNDPTEMKMEEEEEEVNGELFLSSLPDELLTLYEDDTDCRASLDYNSQNPSAVEVAQLPGGSSDRPVTPEMPVTQQLEIIPKIHNVISTVTLGCRLDLNSIAHRAWNVEYNPKKFKSLTMRIREPRATAQIYTSGNLVCVGAKSVEQSRVAARKCARIVQKLGFPVRFLNFKVRNMVASCSTFPLSLERLAQHQCCSYEPELFPGLHWKVLPGVTAIISASGKITLTGAKTEAELYEVFNTIYPTLCCFRR